MWTAWPRSIWSSHLYYMIEMHGNLLMAGWYFVYCIVSGHKLCIPLPRAWQAGQVLCPQSGVYFFRHNRLYEDTKWSRKVNFLWCLVFIFGLSCHYKVHWAWLINSCGHGTRHVVGRVRAWRTTSSRFVVNFKNSITWPLYRDTVPFISWTRPSGEKIWAGCRLEDTADKQ